MKYYGSNVMLKPWESTFGKTLNFSQMTELSIASPTDSAFKDQKGHLWNVNSFYRGNYLDLQSLQESIFTESKQSQQFSMVEQACGGLCSYSRCVNSRK